jgi:hypothetical protein
MMDKCPQCGYQPPTETTVDMLRRRCEREDIIIGTRDDVSEKNAATLIGRAHETMANWRYSRDVVIPHFRVRNRLRYTLAELAAFLDANPNHE